MTNSSIDAIIYHYTSIKLQERNIVLHLYIDD